MKKNLFACLIILCLLGLAVSELAAEKPRLGVLRFTNSTNAGWWNSNVGRELQDMLISELVSTGEFSVLERQEIDAVLSEQDLGASGRVSQATKAKMKRIKGARYLIAGTVSAYEHDTGKAGGEIRVKGLSLGGSKEKSYLAVDVKVIDSETGEIVDAKTIEASAKGGGIGAGLSLRDFSVSGGGSKKTAVGKAIRACIVYVSEYLSCSMVKGKNHKCMDKWKEMDSSRREKTKKSIDLD
jgi:curli biogenesis system outer membrane secretion channel CsgG